MYWVSGSLIIGAPRISSSDNGFRRHAISLSEPLRKARAAACASTRSSMSCSSMYRVVFSAKNWVVSISPVRPYHAPSPKSSGAALKAPRSCLSKPIAMATSADPEVMAWAATVNALPPVAHPLLTLMNVSPVRPRSATSVSAAPADRLPPAANCTSSQPIPASLSAARAALAPCCLPLAPSVRPNRCIPIPTMATSMIASGSVDGLERERDDLRPSGIDGVGVGDHLHRLADV